MESVKTERKIFALSDVTASIQKTLHERYRSAYWIKAEMIKLNYYQHSGHCFPDLVEKRNGRVIAQFKANIWSENFLSINENFKKVIKEPLKDGVKILFLAKVTFHSEHGLSLNIIDIDPNFTLGDLQRERQETIQRLQDEGIFHLNKNLKLPLLPRRIAVISEQSSKGYADFLKVLEEAQMLSGFQFFHMLFPSLLQGERAVNTLITQLRRIKKIKSRFDLVVIVRGGGADLSLTCYDHYELAREIAMFPLPVITGIGHATNLTITEMIAFENAITPTRLAHYLLEYFQDFYLTVQKAEEAITAISKRLLADERLQIENVAKYFRSVTRNLLQKNRHLLKENVQSLSRESRSRFREEEVSVINSTYLLKQTKDKVVQSTKKDMERELLILKKDVIAGVKKHQQQVLQCETDLHQLTNLLIREKKVLIENIEKNVSNLDPSNVLKRGFTITLFNGKPLTKSIDLNEGDPLTTIFLEGQVQSTVINKTAKYE